MKQDEAFELAWQDHIQNNRHPSVRWVPAEEYKLLHKPVAKEDGAIVEYNFPKELTEEEKEQAEHLKCLQQLQFSPETVKLIEENLDPNFVPPVRWFHIDISRLAFFVIVVLTVMSIGCSIFHYFYVIDLKGSAARVAHYGYSSDAVISRPAWNGTHSYTTIATLRPDDTFFMADGTSWTFTENGIKTSIIRHGPEYTVLREDGQTNKYDYFTCNADLGHYLGYNTETGIFTCD